MTDPTTLTLSRLFVRFLRLGLLAFGGPVAQIAMIRQTLIDDERWITGERFNRLLAIMQVLPGPEAHELCVHLGMIARGRVGGLLAGLGFMLPGFVLMMLCGWAYVAFAAGSLAFAGLFLGVQAAVLAIILRAVHRIGSHILTGATPVGLAAIASAGTLAGVPFWGLLAGAAAGCALFARPLPIWLTTAAVAALSVAIASLGDTEAMHVDLVGHRAPTLAALFVAGLKGGLLTFGGAYTAIPYVRADTVGRGWLSDGAFLDGVAVAGLLPAPLVIFATFVGVVTGGWAGGIAITLGMFLPAFAFSLIFFERLEAVLERSVLHGVLDGIAAAVVGIIAATFIDLAIGALARARDWRLLVPIFAVAALLVWRLRGAWVTPAVIGGGAIAGWVLFG